MLSHLFLNYKTTDISLTALDRLCLYASNYLWNATKDSNYKKVLKQEGFDFYKKYLKLELDTILDNVPNSSRAVVESILNATLKSHIDNVLGHDYTDKNDVFLTIEDSHLLFSSSNEKDLDSIIIVPDLSIVVSVNVRLDFTIQKIFINNSKNIILGVKENDC